MIPTAKRKRWLITISRVERIKSLNPVFSTVIGFCRAPEVVGAVGLVTRLAIISIESHSYFRIFNDTSIRYFIKSVQNYKKKSIYANTMREKTSELYKKKEGLSSRQPNLLLNLKSNTMKNTVQRYCFFAYLPNISP